MASEPSLESSATTSGEPTVDRRQYESRARELALVKRVTERLVASLDFRQALDALIEGATELLGVDRGSILLLDEEADELRIEVARGIDPGVVERTRIALGRGIAGRVAATGEPVVAQDVRELPGFEVSPAQAADYADYSALCVPLTLHGRVLGVMNFNHKRSGRPFAERDLEFALLIANQAAIVLWSARLHREFLSKQVLDRELEIARQIQARLIPRDLPELPGLELYARLVTSSAVGGDCFDLFPLHDGRLVVAIGDAAGHGVGAALVAAQVRAVLREVLGRGDTLTDAVARVNDRLASDTSPELYMTMLVGIYDPPTRCLEFVNAGHHMPVLLRHGRARGIRATGRNLPLGIRPGQSYAREFPLGLRPEDQLLFFTDGVWEIEDGAGRRFGDAGVARAFERGAGLGGEALLDELLGAAVEHGGHGEPDDDCTLVLLRFEETYD
jgi:sigma-B regulation protein RsbU (phosphoserine phosphatase)